MSAIAWQGCSSSLSALITGMQACCAMVVTVSCEKVRNTMPSIQRSRVVSDIAQALASAQTRLRLIDEERRAAEAVDASFERQARAQRGLLEEQHDLLARQNAAEIRGASLHGRRQFQRAGELVSREVLDRNQVAAGHAAISVRTRTRSWKNGSSNQCRTSKNKQLAKWTLPWRLPLRMASRIIKVRQGSP
jgi:hypothetical protein